MKRASISLLLIFLTAWTHAASQVDVYNFDNDEQRERYRMLIDELRCPKCLNTNSAGSDAPIAKDLRAAVHRLVVKEGLSDEEVLTFMHERYGDFVLYDPPLNSRTFLIWMLPLMVGLVVLMVLWRMQRNARQSISAHLSDDERAELAQWMDAPEETIAGTGAVEVDK